MPTSNLSCTTMTVKAVDVLQSDGVPAAMYRDHSESVMVEEKDMISFLAEKNSQGGGEIVFRTSLSKLNHGRFPVALVDTPGVNDGMDLTYQDTAIDYLRREKKPTVLFVSHVRSCATTDEEECFRALSEVFNERHITEWFVAINGWNLTDSERDKKEQYSEKIVSLSQKCGLPKPYVFCVSALPAELCSRLIMGESISRMEMIKLEEYLAQCDLFIRAKRNQKELGKISNKTLRTAIYLSGIPLLEQALFRQLKKGER